MLGKYLRCVLPHSMLLFPLLFNGGKFILTSTAGMQQCLDNNINQLDDEVILLRSLKQAAEQVFQV